MIRSIKLNNFKCFKELEIETRALNVLCGINGAGKSSVIQAMLTLRQSWTSLSLSRNRLQLNGSLVELGTAGEVYCAEPGSDCIELQFTSDKCKLPVEIRIPYREDHSGSYSLMFESGPWQDRQDLFELFQEPFNYLHAERIGPRKTFNIPPDEGKSTNVGRYGENAPFIIAARAREFPIRNRSLLLESSDGKSYPTLEYQWPLWMARLFPGYGVDAEIYAAADQIRLGHALQRKQTGQELFVRPTNTGFGVSFVQGILAAGLLAAPETILIVENPEAHLHPRAQSGMGEFLARVAAGGTQVFVETHSEHVVNGMRRMLRQRLLKADDLRLHYFSIPPGTFSPKVESISVADDASLSHWPDGFFDQLDRDLESILG
jgi:predicted ATPase